jgi:two-component system nitrate/nitrite response regulator NarL
MDTDKKLDSPRSKIRVLVVDDHAIVRGFICRLLEAESQFEIVCEAVMGAEAVAKASESQPDVVVLDLNLPDMSGLEVTRRIRWAAPLAEILMLSEHDGPFVREAFRAGARGYLLKSDSPSELVTAIRTVNQGHPYVSMRLDQPLKKAL